MSFISYNSKQSVGCNKNSYFSISWKNFILTNHSVKYPLIKPKYYANLFKELAQFIKNPRFVLNTEKSTRIKIYDTVGLFVLKIFFLIALAMVMALISPWFDPENITKSNMSERFSIPMFLLVGGFILPLLEEVCFRLSIRFKPLHLALTLAVVCYYLLTKAVYATSFSMIDESFVIRAFSSLAFGFIVYLISSIQKVKFSLAYFWQMNVKWIYYISCASFAWVHIFNYELSLVNLILLPIITLPQLMSALINGYTRLAFGFQYPLLFHFTNNVIAIGISQLPFSDLLR